MWARPARAPVAAGPTFRHARVRRWCSARKTARRAPEGGEPCRARAAKPFCYDLGDGRAKRSRPSGVGQRRPTRSLLRWGGLGPPAQLPSPSIARRARWGTRPSLNPPPLHSQALDLSPPTNQSLGPLGTGRRGTLACPARACRFCRQIVGLVDKLSTNLVSVLK